MVSSLYLFLLAVVFLTLTIRVILVRKSLKISLGDGNEPRLQRAICAHKNFCETTPLAAVMMILAEASTINIIIIHACGGVLLLGRILHAISISSAKENIKIRIAGMTLTLLSIASLAGLNLLVYVVTILGLK